jgi:hypothetical protein
MVNVGDLYRQTGKLVEKYDVMSVGRSGGGGEYPTQDGFGWTNGVMRKLSGSIRPIWGVPPSSNADNAARQLRLPLPTLGIEAQGSVGASAAAFLQQLDRDLIRRAHERHAAVARRPADRHTAFHQPAAGRVDVVYLVGQVPEVAAARVAFRVPVVRQLDLRLSSPGAARKTSV